MKFHATLVFLPSVAFAAALPKSARSSLSRARSRASFWVTCDMPFCVVGKSDPAIDEWREDERTLWLNWPVQIWAQGDDEDMPLPLFAAGPESPRSRSFMMFVSPSCLGGSFTWTNFCCSISGGGNSFTCTCREGCGCGECWVRGYYGYAGYRLPATGGGCSCCYEEDPVPSEDDPGQISYSSNVMAL